MLDTLYLVGRIGMAAFCLLAGARAAITFSRPPPVLLSRGGWDRLEAALAAAGAARYRAKQGGRDRIEVAG